MSTSYFELLATPLIAVGAPLALLPLIVPVRRPVREVCLLFCVWLAGYALMWAAKWLLSELLTSESVLSGVFCQAKVWAAHAEKTYSSLIVAHGPLSVSLGAVIFALLVIAMCNSRRREAAMKSMWLLVVALLPMAWFLAIKTHSLVHFWFTWRDFSITVFALALFAWRVLGAIKER